MASDQRKDQLFYYNAKADDLDALRGELIDFPYLFESNLNPNESIPIKRARINAEFRVRLEVLMNSGLLGWKERETAYHLKKLIEKGGVGLGVLKGMAERIMNDDWDEIEKTMRLWEKHDTDRREKDQHKKRHSDLLKFAGSSRD